MILPSAPAHGSATVTVRRLSSAFETERREWQAVLDLCCLTGANGQPVPTASWDFFGRLWIGPYQKLFPEWTYIAEAGDAVVGYLTGCPDTRLFARRQLFHCTLPLLLRVAQGRYSRDGYVRRFVRQSLGLEENAEESFPREVRKLIEEKYPAHLHVNVRDGFRRQGVGGQLVEKYCFDLRAQGVRGVHLYCGTDPVRFYLDFGFQQLGAILFHGAEVYALGRML